MRWRAPGLVSLLVATVVLYPAPATADPNPNPCTPLDTTVLLHAGIRGFDPVNNNPADQRIDDLVERCQYRLYLDGETFTFHTNDYFLGGVFFYYTYAELQELGWTRAQAIADMERLDVRVWLAPALPNGDIGEPVEQELRQTAYRNYDDSELGMLVYTHYAFTTRLPTGNYVSILRTTYPGEPVSVVDKVNLQIHPAHA